MSHSIAKKRVLFATAVLVGSFCTTRILPAAESAPAAASGGHAAAAAPAAHADAPSAPVQASPAANPTTPAGTNAPSPSVKQTPTNGAAPSVVNGANDHRRHDHNQQYEAAYGNSLLPDATGWYGNGDGNTGYNNANYSTDNSAPAATPAPVPTPATPSNNSTSIAAQADNAVDHSPEMVNISADIQRAQAAVDSDRQRVIAKLADNPDYQKAIARQDDARKNMSDVKPLGAGVPGTPAPSVMNAASAKLDASDEVTKMQEAAIAADPQAASDMDRLTKLVAEKDTQAARLRGQH